MANFNFGYSGGIIIPEFGLIPILVIISFFVNFFYTIQVYRARKKFGIEAPRMTETQLPPSVLG